jgi:hypothetical protein
MQREGYKPYTGKSHYFRNVDSQREEQLEDLIKYLHESGLDFFGMNDIRKGPDRFIEVTVCIKLS